MTTPETVPTQLILDHIDAASKRMAEAQNNMYPSRNDSRPDPVRVIDKQRASAIFVELHRILAEARAPVPDCGQSTCADHDQHLATAEGEPQGPGGLSPADLDGGDGEAVPESLVVAPGTATAEKSLGRKAQSDECLALLGRAYDLLIRAFPGPRDDVVAINWETSAAALVRDLKPWMLAEVAERTALDTERSK